MKRILAATLCLFFGFAYGTSDFPSFSWTDEASPFGVPFLKINFPDGGKDDFAIMRSYNPVPLAPQERSEDLDSCIYQGYLLHENDVHVTMTGCAMSDNFKIQFSSKRLNRDMFKVFNGVVSGIEEKTRYLLSEGGNKAITDSKPDRQLKPLSKNGYIANIKVFYDPLFNQKFGSDTANAIRRILAHTQHVLKWPTLTTKVILNSVYGVQPITEILDASISTRTYSKKYAVDKSIHSHMFFGIFNRTMDGDTLGKAYLGGACDSALTDHALMMKYEDDDVSFARSLAHEFGHNLNFRHDNPLENGSPRKDSQGNLCTGIGSIMDYAKGKEGNKRQWSTCVVEDFTELINEYPTCLKEIDPLKPPTEITDQNLSSHECNLSKIKADVNGYHDWNLNGKSCMTICIESVCAPTGSRCTDPGKTACQNICGGNNCGL